jgi:hypothetical protein
MEIYDGYPSASDNDWETIKCGRDIAVLRRFDNQLKGTSYSVVLNCSQKAGQKWTNLEIKTSWNNNKELAGIYINNLCDATRRQSRRHANIFSSISIHRAA